MMNTTLVGRVGTAPVTKEVGNSQVTEFSVATDLGFGKNKKTQWNKVSIWGNRGVALAEFLSVGTPLTVFGTVTDLTPGKSKKTGEDLVFSSVTANEVVLQGKREQAAAPTKTTQAPTNRVAPNNKPQGGYTVEDIPC